jgi:hypothetical protein
MIRMGLENIGTEGFDRFVIVNERGEAWGGEGWVSVESGQPLVFADPFEAGKMVHWFQTVQFEDKPYHQVFECPAIFDVFGDQPVSPLEVKAWLNTAMAVVMNYLRFGTGPEGSGVVGWIGLSDLREVCTGRQPNPKDPGSSDGFSVSTDDFDPPLT